MAEERRCQEGLRCANNCGFFGSPTTLNLCSKCYHDHLKAEQDLIAVEKSLLLPASSAMAAALSSFSSSSFDAEAQAPAEAAVEQPEAEGPKRCTACRKKVGLTGFRCRCGSTFCGSHRYPEKHACGFDYKAAGREAIARSNPIVQADKLRKI